MGVLGLVNFYRLARTGIGPLWAVWLGAAALTLLFSGLWRVRDPRLKGPHRQREWAGLLGICAIASFAAYLLAQIVYATVRQSAMQAGKEGIPAADIVRVSLIAASVGWLIGLSLLHSTRAINVVGYSIRRILPGVCDGIVGIFIAMPFVFVVFNVSHKLWLHYIQEPQSEHELLKALHDNSNGRFVEVGVVLAAVIAAPLFEEMLFRGFIQGGLRRLTNSRWIAVTLSSAMFAAIHDRWTIPPIFVLSLFLGFAYERKQNLWTSTVMHALFNLFNIITSGIG